MNAEYVIARLCDAADWLLMSTRNSGTGEMQKDDVDRMRDAISDAEKWMSDNEKSRKASEHE